MILQHLTKDLVVGRGRQLLGSGLMLAAVVAALALTSAHGHSQTGAAHVARFIPSDEQLRNFHVQTVGLRTFRSEIVTDGYVAAGTNGHTGGLPVLPSQASDMLQAENDLAAARVQYRNAFGRAYMAAISGVHHAYVAPAMLRSAVESVAQRHAPLSLTQGLFA